MAIEKHDRWTADELEVVRSEEELRTTVEAVPYERVRLTKRIVAETVHVEVQLQRELLVVERLSLDAADGDDAGAPEPPRAPVRRLRDSVLARFATRSRPAVIAADDVIVELLEERYEVVKRVVPRERVRLLREVRTVQAPVSATIRKEHIEVDRHLLDGHAG